MEEVTTFPWYSQYPEGVPQQLEYDDQETLIDLFEHSFSKYADRPAFENMGRSFTYREIDKLSTNFAAYLQQELGLQPGDSIAIQMPNTLQYPIAMVGALKAGLTVVNTNPLYTAREMLHQFTDASVKVVVILANFAHNLEKILDQTRIESVIVTELGDQMQGLKRPLVNFVVKNVKKMVPAYNLPGALKFNEVLAKGANLSYTRPPINSEDIAFYQYTGGTTGVSKGAQLSHRNIIAHTRQVIHWFNPMFLKQKEQVVIITAIPLYHIFALTVNGIFMMAIGSKNVLITNPRDMKGFIKELKKHRFTLFTGVNTLFNGLLNQPEFASVDFSNLKISVGGGMAVQDKVARKWEEVTKSPLIEGYGLSETSPVLCCNPVDGSHQIGTIGLPMPGTEVGIFDEEGNQLPAGEIGEICARGPQVFKGYLNHDNEGVFHPGGWFRTGDMGKMAENGYFTIVDRKKDMVNVSGFNVYPNEVENVIVMHEKVLEVGIIGIPDEKTTEAVKACVVRYDESLTIEELRGYCKENLTAYKVPKHVIFLDELPKSNVGKILRRELREAHT